MYIFMHNTRFFLYLTFYILESNPSLQLGSLSIFLGTTRNRFESTHTDTPCLWMSSCSEAEFGRLAREACSEVPHNHQTAMFGAQLHWLCPLSSTAINAWRLYGDLGQDLPCKAQVFFRKFWPQN